jgi:hypothetical protein
MPLHFVQPCVRDLYVCRDDRLSRNELGFGIVLQEFLGRLTGGLGHESRDASLSI